MHKTMTEEVFPVNGSSFRVTIMGGGDFIALDILGTGELSDEEFFSDNEEPVEPTPEWHSLFAAQGEEAEEFVSIYREHGGPGLISFLDGAGVQIWQ